MICPHCGATAPDANYRCPSCKKTLKENMDPANFRKPEPAPSRWPVNRILFTIVLVFAGILIFLIINKALTPDIPERLASANPELLNIGRQGTYIHVPGSEIDIASLADPERTVIFDFYSEHCGPCREIAPWLQKLADKRYDVNVIKININRDEVKDRIDWESPVIKQHHVTSLPHFVIYEKGVFLAEGRAAANIVLRMFREEGL